MRLGALVALTLLLAVGECKQANTPVATPAAGPAAVAALELAAEAAAVTTADESCSADEPHTCAPGAPAPLAPARSTPRLARLCSCRHTRTHTHSTPRPARLGPRSHTRTHTHSAPRPVPFDVNAPTPYDNDVKPAAPPAGTYLYDPAGLLSPEATAEFVANLTKLNQVQP